MCFIVDDLIEAGVAATAAIASSEAADVAVSAIEAAEIPATLAVLGPELDCALGPVGGGIVNALLGVATLGASVGSGLAGSAGAIVDAGVTAPDGLGSVVGAGAAFGTGGGLSSGGALGAGSAIGVDTAVGSGADVSASAALAGGSELGAGAGATAGALGLGSLGTGIEAGNAQLLSSLEGQDFDQAFVEHLLAYANGLGGSDSPGMQLANFYPGGGNAFVQIGNAQLSPGDLPAGYTVDDGSTVQLTPANFQSVGQPSTTPAATAPAAAAQVQIVADEIEVTPPAITLAPDPSGGQIATLPDTTQLYGIPDGATVTRGPGDVWYVPGPNGGTYEIHFVPSGVPYQGDFPGQTPGLFGYWQSDYLPAEDLTTPFTPGAAATSATPAPVQLPPIVDYSRGVPPVLPPSDSLYTPQGPFSREFEKQANTALGPGTSPGQRYLSSLAAQGLLPLATYEEFVRSVANIPHVVRSVADEAGQHIGRAGLLIDRGQTGEAVLEYLMATEGFSLAFDLIGTTALPGVDALDAQASEAADLAALRQGSPRLEQAAVEKVMGNLRGRTPSGSLAVTQDTLEHVFEGQVKVAKGGVVKATGFHYEGTQSIAEPATEVVRVTKGPNPAGVYQAEVQVQGIAKDAQSTFFPRSWTRAQVVQGIDQAYTSRVLRPGTSLYIGQGSGIQIGMFLNSDGTIATAFPLL